MKRIVRVNGLLVLFLTMAGCAVSPLERDEAIGSPAERQREEAVSEPEGTGQSGGRSGQAKTAEPARAAPAVVALQDQADTASGAGEHGRAASLLERALRIDPQNATLWHNLAVVRYREADYAQAESMAMRSNRYAGDQRALRQGNWQLIAVSRELSGDNSGADEALRRARAASGGGSL